MVDLSAYKNDLSTREELWEQSGLVFVRFPALTGTGLVEHGFSTRIGGVSTGPSASLNYTYVHGDTKENVDENFRRTAEVFGTAPEQIVTSQQTHTANIRRVTKADAGKGVVRERDYRDIDGLITDVPGLLLSTMHADCTPVFLVDPVHRAIGLVHSGWRGTVQQIGRQALLKMMEAFGTDPEDVLAAIGPCACGRCYEVGPEVAEPFIEMLGADVCRKSRGDRYLLDQKAANRRILENAGVPSGQISVSGLCTMEQDELFFSHRRMGLVRGSMAAFMMLKDEA